MNKMKILLYFGEIIKICQCNDTRMAILYTHLLICYVWSIFRYSQMIVYTFRPELIDALFHDEVYHMFMLVKIVDVEFLVMALVLYLMLFQFYINFVKFIHDPRYQ